jgi:hypothetical protein
METNGVYQPFRDVVYHPFIVILGMVCNRVYHKKCLIGSVNAWKDDTQPKEFAAAILAGVEPWDVG